MWNDLCYAAWRQNGVDQVGFKIIGRIKVQKTSFHHKLPCHGVKPSLRRVRMRKNALTHCAYPDCMLSVHVGDHKVLAKPCR